MHLLGLGGAGMSGYARVAVALGARVSGSDRADGPALAALRELGVDVHVGHAAANVPAGDDVELFFSSAVATDNPERAAARARGLAEHPRAVLLERLSALKRTIAVAGAHGKTTTTSMVAHVLLRCGLEPAYLIGGELRSTGRNADWGGGDWLVVEADESDRSMLSLHVEIAVVTNVELDHHATFRSLTELRDCFRAFLAGAPQAVLWDRPDVLALRGDAPHVTFDVVDAAPRRGRLALFLARPRGRAAGPRRAQRAQRRGGARGVPAGRRRPRRRGRRAGRLRRRRPAFRAARGDPVGGDRHRRLRPPPDRGGGHHRRRPDARRRGAWWRSSSRTCTRAPRTWRASSARRWPAPTYRSCSTSTRRASAPRTSPGSADC